MTKTNTLPTPADLPKVKKNRRDYPSKRRGGPVGPRTTSFARTRLATKAEWAADYASDVHALGGEDQVARMRPKTFGQCQTVPGPCPWVGCRHHLKYDVLPSGNLLDNQPGVELEDMPETCSLRAAKRARPQEDVAEMLRLTRERIRHIETLALRKAQRNGHGLEDHAEWLDDDRPVVGDPFETVIPCDRLVRRKKRALRHPVRSRRRGR